MLGRPTVLYNNIAVEQGMLATLLGLAYASPAEPTH